MTRSGHLLRIRAATLPNMVPHTRAMAMARRPTLQDMGKDSAIMLLEGYAEVALQEFLEVNSELGHEGLIQIVSGVKRSDGGRVEGFFTVERAARNGVHKEKCDCAYYEYSENSKQEALDDVFRHILPSFLSYY